MGEPTRWQTETEPGHSGRYVEHFRRLAADGADLAGEARLVDAMVRPRSRVLDAGCGQGRVAAALHERGHDVVGVDADPEMVAAASHDHPGPRWQVADLSQLDLGDERFDAAVMAGNVLVYVAPGTERRVLGRLRAHLVPDGFLVIGMATDRAYGVPALDADLTAAGFVLEHRFATWDLRPWRDDADFAVSVLRVPDH